MYPDQKGALRLGDSRGGHPLGTVVLVLLLAGILPLVGTVSWLEHWSPFLRATDWNSDRFRGALRENRTITAAALMGVGLDVAGAAVRLLACGRCQPR